MKAREINNEMVGRQYRLPKNITDNIDKSAMENKRSINSEVIVILEKYFKQEKQNEIKQEQIKGEKLIAEKMGLSHEVYIELKEIRELLEVHEDAIDYLASGNKEMAYKVLRGIK